MPTTVAERRARRGDPEPARGFLGSLLHEVGLDLTGATKLSFAPALSALEFLGAEVPFTFDDIERRDWQGAAMIASMFVGGAVAQGVKGAKAGVGAFRAQKFASLVPNITKAEQIAARAKAAEWAAGMKIRQNVAILASSEAVAGAAFGAVAPLEESQSKLRDIALNAGLFGVTGGAFGLLGGGFNATVGKRLREVKKQTRATRFARLIQNDQTRRELFELAGRKFENPSNGHAADVFRKADGTYRVSTPNSKSETFKSWDSAVDAVRERGFTDEIGPINTRLKFAGKRLQNSDKLPEDIVDEFAALNGDVVKFLDQINLEDYQSLRKFTREGLEIDNLANALEAEVLVSSGGSALKPIKLDAATRAGFMQVVAPSLARKLGKIKDDADFLRTAMYHGAVDVEHLASGVSEAALVRELAFNNSLPASMLKGEGPFRPTDIRDMGVMSHLATPRFLSKIHPELQPAIKIAADADDAYTMSLRSSKQFVAEMRRDLGPKVLNQVMEFIERPEFSELGVLESGIAAKEMAKVSGDSQLFRGVTAVVDKLNAERIHHISLGRLGTLEGADPNLVRQARQELVELIQQSSDDNGILQMGVFEEAFTNVQNQELRALVADAGQSAYFPRVHNGRYRLSEGGEFRGRYDSLEEANKAAAELTGVTMVTQATSFAPEAMKISSKRLATIHNKYATHVIKDKRGRFLQPRSLDMETSRFYSEDALTSLDFYLTNSARVRAYNTFERSVDNILNTIPANKSQVKRYMQEWSDGVLGRMSKTEEQYRNLTTLLFPNANPDLINKSALAVRRWQSLFKLGGFWSGIVNSTQLAINTVPVVGVKYTTVGLDSVINPAKRKKTLAFWSKVNLGTHTNFMHDGSVADNESARAAFRTAFKQLGRGEKGPATKSAWEGAQSVYMWSFNNFEQINRVATAEGAYRQYLAEVANNPAAALLHAKDVVNRTQFDYGSHNIPLVLNDPVMSVLGQFKTFFINELEFIAGLSDKEMAKMAGTVGFMGGFGGLLEIPGVDLINLASNALFDKRMDEALKLGVLEAENEGDFNPVTRLAAFGAPGLVGLDMTNYIGPGGLYDVTRGLFGPSISDFGALIKFVGQVAMDSAGPRGGVDPNTYKALLTKIMPSQLRRFQLGREIIQTGEVRSQYSDKLLYRPETRVDAVMAAAGGRNTRLSMERAADDFVRRTVDSHRNAVAGFKRQMAMAAIQGNTEELARLQLQARQAGVVIKPEDLKEAIKNFNMTAAERRERTTPIMLRDELDSFF